MSIRRLFLFLLVVVAFLLATGISTKSNNTGPALTAGRNVNMTSSKEWPDPEGDVYLQRQNEPSLAVSTLNPLHLLAGANDFRSVDTWESQGNLPGIPEEAAAGDAWLGVFTSYDGGQSWKSKLLPGYIDDPTPEFGDSLKGFKAASDPTVRAGIDGFFYYSGIAFSRERNGPSVIFVCRYKDYNDTEGYYTPEDNNATETEEPDQAIRYIDTTIIDEGTSGQFADKPWMAVDIPRSGYLDGLVYLVYSTFLGDITKTVHDKIMFARSIDGGITWETPIKLSESHRINQGTTVAIDPQNGDVYVAWRRWAAGKDPDAILVAKSTNNGQTFTKTVEAAIIEYPFDQPTVDLELETAQFRTNAFPTMTVDNNNTVYIAWTQREYENGPARIFFASSLNGIGWPPQTRIHKEGTAPDDYYAEGHMFMPSMSFAAGKLLIAWYDSRDSVRLEHGGATEKWLTDYYLGEGVCPDPSEGDYPCHWRETIDVRIAQAVPGASQFEPSMQVSRYIWFFEVDGGGNPIIENGYLKPIQVQFNAPNFPLFQGGTAPFIGDYIDLVPAPMFINDRGNWRFNTGQTPSDPNLPPDPFVFYVSWTDNRDVRPPAEDITGVTNPWEWYGPPDHLNCISGFNAGMRNQNIYVSRITSGISVGCPGNYKLSGPEQKAFVVNVENMTGSRKSFDLNIFNPPPNGSASFSPSETLSSLTINVDEYSSISRHVFVQSDSPHTTIVQASELGVGNFIGYVYLYLVADGGSTGQSIELSIIDGGVINWSNPPPGILPIPNADITNPVMFNPVMFNPVMFNPVMFNPVMFNPVMFNPVMFNPVMFNANIFNPVMFNPVMFNGNVANPVMFNRTIDTPIAGAEIVDKFWQVTNIGDTASSYTLKTIAGDDLPDTYYSQLLVYKVHRTPATDGTCTLLFDNNHELLLNIENPNITPDITTYAKIVDPELANVDFTNATFSLAPGEDAIVILRVIDATGFFPAPSPGGFGGFGDFGGFGGALGGQTSPSISPEEFADNVGAVVVSHSSTVGDITAITLMILPGSLPSGQAGEPYVSEPIKAIGGELGVGQHYSWQVNGLPSGLKYNTVYDSDFDDMIVISGDPWPREAGNFLITVQVTDHSSPPQTDTQTFKLEILAADPFTLTMEPESPVVDTTMDPNSTYSQKFIAEGGVPLSEVAPFYTWDSSEAPPGLAWSLSNDNGREILELSGTLSTPNNYQISVSVTDFSYPPNKETKTYNLCVRPPVPLDIAPDKTQSGTACQTDPQTACALPDGELGTEYSRTFWPVNNANVGDLTWDLFKNPSWLELITPINGSNNYIEISGTPVYEIGATYPKPYDFEVELTQAYIFSDNCQETRTVSRKFKITINPKQPAWFAEGTENGEATAVATDSSGNIYVTGYTFSEETGKNYYTVKYGGEGNFIWGESYNGPGNGDKKDDIPTAIAVNSSGVYITGSSVGRRSGPDIYTIKYDPASGDVLWDDRYDGPSHLGDGANDLTLDDDGNVYVAGFVHRGKQEKHADYCVIKYDPAGEIIWDERYDSTRNGSDYATAVAVDKAGNVYLTGKSQERLKKEPTTLDYLTLKYNKRGRLQWQARDDGPHFGDDEPTDIALHEVSPNEVYVYVTGYTSGGMAIEKDYYTVKYDAEGNGNPEPGWGISYNGNGNEDDVATAIAVDESTGEVYVTGKSRGNNGYDYATIKYDVDGSPQWNTDDDGAIRYDGLVGDDEAVAVAADDTGIYVAGFSTIKKDETQTDKDFFIIKYNTSGAIIWIASYDGPSGLDDVATAMAVNSGIYVVGYSDKGSSNTVFAVVKYDK